MNFTVSKKGSLLTTTPILTSPLAKSLAKFIDHNHHLSGKISGDGSGFQADAKTKIKIDIDAFDLV